ncbi:MAG TPA: response regulator transcription factor [Leadbetterella sp.]|nr:response regulator transcription factor [Leadbetterella sp.]
MKKILLVEDDPHVCAIVKKGLEEESFEVEEAHDGEKGYYMANANTYDLVILDIMLPKMTGLELCQKIRSTSNVPILLLTALGTAENVAMGLNQGADDYLVKPFKFIELIARINSLLRRSTLTTPESAKLIFKYSVIEINDTSKVVTVSGREVQLTSTEYKLLLLLLKMPNKVFSRQEILEEVWGINFDLGTNVVDVYVNYLRKKLDKQNCPKIIQTVVGMGYVMRE